MEMRLVRRCGSELQTSWWRWDVGLLCLVGDFLLSFGFGLAVGDGVDQHCLDPMA